MTPFDPKIILALIGTLLLIISYIPYFRDIFLRKTKPHIYTWLVWSVTQGTAAAASWYGGGKWASFGLTIGAISCFLIFLFSFKYGTKNITRSDTGVLVAALLAIFIWWQLNNPILAIIAISLIDGLGYIPTYRKSFIDPWSETLTFWSLGVLAIILIIISSAQYNVLTITYPIVITVANALIVIICSIRRRKVPKPTLY